MFCEVEFVQSVKLSYSSEETFKLAENIQFTVFRDRITHHIKNIKGDLKITKITETDSSGRTMSLEFYESRKEFVLTSEKIPQANIYITANVKMKEIGVEFSYVNYRLQIPSDRLKTLLPLEFFKSIFVLPGYDDLKFTYYVKKIKESPPDDIEVFFENLDEDVAIEGKKGNFKHQQSSSENINLFLTFRVNTNVYPPSVVHSNDQKPVIGDSSQTSAFDLYCPESVPPPHFSNNGTNLLQKLYLNNRFADVFFIISDGTKIPAHRIILAEFSEIFFKIFEEGAQLPLKIDVEDSNAETVQSVMKFCYGQPDSISGKEIEVFKFALKYNIEKLIDACILFFVETADSSNVCEYVQIAYANNFAELKQKCLKTLVQKKDEIDPTKISDLPKNIIVDAFCMKF